MLIVRRSTFDQVQNLLKLERQATSSMQRTLTNYDRDIRAANLELDALRAELDAVKSERDSLQKRERRLAVDLQALQSSYDGALAASAEVVAERDRALSREREANSRAHNAATVLKATETKLADCERILNLSRSRREVIGAQLDTLRAVANKVAITSREGADFLSANSSPGSEARMHAECIYDELADLDAALNN